MKGGTTLIMKKQDLLYALEKVKPGLAQSELIEQTTSFAFINGYVVTYNDQICVSHPLPNVKIEGAVKARELYALLNKFKQDKLSLSIQGSELQLICGKAKAGLTLETEINLPLSEFENVKYKWKRVPNGFLDAIKFTIFSCSDDMSLPVLTCIHVNEGGIVESCDNYRLTRYLIESKIPVHTFLLPADVARELVKYAPSEMAQGKGWVHFKTKEGSLFHARIYQEKYPDISALLEVKGDTITLPKGLPDVLDRAMIFAKRDLVMDETVQIQLQNKRMKIRAESDTGWFEEELRLSYTGDNISLLINPRFLKDIHARSRACVLSEARDRLKFESKDRVHVIALAKE